MILKTLMAAALLGTALSSAAAADLSNGPIRSVTLSSGGLAEIERRATVKDEGNIRIEVPLEQVDDVLKSLVVRDADGKVLGVTLAGPAPLEETFRTLPFSADDLGSLPALLSSIQGTAVTVTSGSKTVSGQVLGVETRNDSDGRSLPLLTVLDASGSIRSLYLAADAEATVEDAEMRRKIAEATAAAGKGKTDGSRTVSIALDGKDSREVAISYVVAAPVWKTAYRALVGPDGQSRLQAWAILENASGEDWDDVKIALSSGDPVTLKQKLHQRYWRARPEIPVAAAPQNVPPADTGNVAMRSMTMKAGRTEMAPHAPLAAIAIADDAAHGNSEAFYMSPAADTGTASEGDVTVSFELPGEHDLANGDTMSVPIIDATVDAEMVSVYRSGSASAHPVAAVLLNNSTGISMPPGILTVYDASLGYVGDAQLLGLPAGDSRMASFAADRKISVREEHLPDRRVTTIKVVDGTIRASVKHRNIVVYHLSGAADGDRSVVIEHPRMEGWTFSGTGSDGETSTHHRLKVKLEAGTTRSVTAVHEMVSDETYGLVSADPAMLMEWAGSAQEEAVASKLKELAEARRAQARAQSDLRHLEEDLRIVEREQERVRQNLDAIPENSDLHRNYLSMLEEQEGRIAEISRQMKDVRETARLRGDEVADIIRTF